MVTAIKGNATSTFGGNVDVPQIITDAPLARAKVGSNYTVSPSTWTKVQLNAEDYDTNNNFDPTTNYRFTPTVAGYYQVNGNLYSQAATSVSRTILRIIKNGATETSRVDLQTSGTNAILGVSDIVYMNGSTDYLELESYHQGTGTLTVITNLTNFSAVLVRAV